MMTKVADMPMGMVRAMFNAMAEAVEANAVTHELGNAVDASRSLRVWGSDVRVVA